LFKKAAKGLKHYTSGTVGLIAVNDVIDIMVKLMKSNITNERFVLVAENWHYKKFLQALAESVNTSSPKKLVNPQLLKLAWKLDWLKTKLTGKRRRLTKHIAKSLTTEKNYSSDKIKEALGYSFNPIDKSIKDTGAIYLKQVQ
jgi:nucleoside-diphosphate-sugar epimerase